MFILKVTKTILLSIPLFSFGMSYSVAAAQESELEVFVNSVKKSLPVNQYSEHRDTVMEVSCNGLDWTLGWSERSNLLTGKVSLTNGLKVYDVSEIETAIFQNFSMINTPVVICSDRNENGVSYPTQIFVTGTEVSSSKSKAIEITFNPTAEKPVNVQILKVDNVFSYVDEQNPNFDELTYDTTISCGKYKWRLEWKKNIVNSEGVVFVNYENQQVTYDPIGRSIFDKFSQLGTPSLLCITHRSSMGLVEGVSSSQLRLMGASDFDGGRAHAVISAHINQGLLVLDAKDLTK